MTRAGVDGIGVVIPAHNEEPFIVHCLQALDAARAHLIRSGGPRTVVACVALDNCTDGTPDIVNAWAADRDWLGTLTLGHACVGAARRDAVTALQVDLATVGAVDPARIWIANTDADSVVPVDWLLQHARAAELGADLLLGQVTPDTIAGEVAVDAQLLALWRTRHPDDGAYVHGANLGVRLSLYHEAGGFPSIPAHEDVALVEAVRARTDRVALGSRVRTSSRLRGRAPAGFAHYLRTLADELNQA